MRYESSVDNGNEEETKLFSPSLGFYKRGALRKDEFIRDPCTRGTQLSVVSYSCFDPPGLQPLAGFLWAPSLRRTYRNRPLCGAAAHPTPGAWRRTQAAATAAATRPRAAREEQAARSEVA